MTPFTPWLRGLASLRKLARQRESGKQPRRGVRRTRRPLLEVLEDRAVPSTLTVLNINDSGTGSLRQAILDAAAGDTIVFQSGLTGTIRLDDSLTIDKSLRVSGPGRELLTVSGADLGSVAEFRVATDIDVTLSGLTIANADIGIWYDRDFGGSGGGSLTVSDCTISGNHQAGLEASNAGLLTVSNCTISGNGGADWPGRGGIRSNYTPLAVSNCTFSGNRSSGEGGGIWSNGGVTRTVTNCTFSGNWAGLEGGAIWVTAGNTTVSNCTISGNTAYSWGGGIHQYQGNMTVSNCTIVDNTATQVYSFLSAGAGISTYFWAGYWYGTLTLSNTIVARNQGGNGHDIGERLPGTPPVPVVSLGHNLIGNADGSVGWVGSDLLGTSASPLDPLLGPLQDNGGPTKTMALLLGSPAIDRGNPDPTGLPAYDQRGPGFQRVANGRVDIGAFEKQANAATLPSQGAGAPIVTLESPAGTTLTQVTALPEPDPANVVVPPQEFARFPVGAFHFQVGVAQGATAEVVLYVPTGTQINAYYKQDPADGKWYKYTAARFEDRNGDGTADVVLPLTDGNSGDADGQANGVIVDPGAPAFQALPVQIDVKPGDSSNSTNLASQGVIAVAILSTADFDAAWVDVASVLFAGARVASYARKDVNGDGRLDLVLNFRTQDTNLRALYEQLLADDINADGVLDSSHQQLQVALTGRTSSDVFFEGVDHMDLFLSGKALRQMLDELAAAGLI